MRKQRGRLYLHVILLGAMLSFGGLASVSAESSSSTHYKVDQAQFDSGAGLHNCSGTYCANISVGDTTVGQAASAHYTATFGPDTDAQPLLEVISESGTQNLGFLDTTHTATATRYLKVRDYLSAGYVVELTGSPPTQGVHALNALTSPSTSQPGTEQFGVNVVANTSPAIGADPVQVPNSSTSFGVAYGDYASANLFKYASGDIIAQSTKSSGETDYTISMIINVSNVTPGGHYDGSFSAVVVPVY